MALNHSSASVLKFIAIAAYLPPAFTIHSHVYWIIYLILPPHSWSPSQPSSSSHIILPSIMMTTILDSPKSFLTLLFYNFYAHLLVRRLFFPKSTKWFYFPQSFTVSGFVYNCVCCYHVIVKLLIKWISLQMSVPGYNKSNYKLHIWW